MVSELKKLERQRDALLKDVNRLNKEIAAVRENTDIYGLLDFLSRKKVWVSLIEKEVTLKSLVKYAEYYRLRGRATWFNIVVDAKNINEVLCFQLTSYLFANNLYIFNIVNDTSAREKKIQIGDVESIRDHMRGWGIDEHLVKEEAEA
jgi:hypothetical protein